jgi:hypothetical protein
MFNFRHSCCKDTQGGPGATAALLQQQGLTATCTPSVMLYVTMITKQC